MSAEPGPLPLPIDFDQDPLVELAGRCINCLKSLPATGSSALFWCPDPSPCRAAWLLRRAWAEYKEARARAARLGFRRVS